MAIICNELKLIYFLAPGTGSSALSDFLVKNYNGRRVPDSAHNLLDKNGNFIIHGKHSTYNELVAHNLITKEEQSYLKITGIRNPFDYFYAEWFRSRTRFSRLLGDRSSWVYSDKNPQSRIDEIVNTVVMEFSDWIVHKFKGPYQKQKHLSLHPQYINYADAFVKSEHMNRDLTKILSEHCGLNTRIEVPKKNVSSRDRCYWRHYSREARITLGTVYQPYLEKFDYAF